MTKLKEPENKTREFEQKVNQNEGGSLQGSKSPVYWMLAGAAISIVSILASFLVPDNQQRDAVPVAPSAPTQNSSKALQ